MLSLFQVKWVFALLLNHCWSGEEPRARRRTCSVGAYRNERSNLCELGRDACSHEHVLVLELAIMI